MNVLKVMKKIFILMLIIGMLSFIVVPRNNSFAAATKYTQSLKSGISNFPKEYQSALNKLKELHPNWEFTLFYTKLNWEEVIENEEISSITKIIIII